MKRATIGLALLVGACSGEQTSSSVAPSAIVESGFATSHDGELGACKIPGQQPLCHAERYYLFSEECVLWHVTNHPKDNRGECSRGDK